MDRDTKIAIGFGISMALLFDVGSQNNFALAIAMGILFGGGFYAYRKRKRSRP